MLDRFSAVQEKSRPSRSLISGRRAEHRFGKPDRAHLPLAAGGLTGGSELTYLPVTPGNQPVGLLRQSRKEEH